MTSRDQNNLIVLLQCDNLQEALDWKLLNERWMAAGRDKVYTFSFARGHFECQEFGTLEPLGGVVEATELLICAPTWNLSPNWRDTVQRANDLFVVKSVTGRRLVPDRHVPKGASHQDRTPSLLEPYITEWNLSGSIHGVACQRLPNDLLWVSSSARVAMMRCLALSGTLDDAVDAFYDDNLVPRNFGKNIYLPDFIALQR